MNDQYTDQVIDDVMQREEKNRQALSLLLDQQREKEGHLFVLRTRMGETSSYVTTVTLKWVAENVQFAQDLPIFKGKIDKTTKKILVDEKTIGDIQQRPPDWSRQLPMALYLATRRNHKFPPLLVVGYQDWVYNDNAEQWDMDNSAMQDSLTVISLEPKAIYCDLDVNNTKYYALDGQHRLMAIIGLRDLLQKGKLFSLDVNGKPNPKRFITREAVIEEIQKERHEDEGTIHNRLESLMNESIGLEIIPAVTHGEKYKEALFRLRGTFVDVNENAKRLTTGELVQLDEIDGFRVAARNVMVSHDLLKGKVDTKQPQLNEKSESYTTLQTVVEIARYYLGSKTEFSRWRIPMLGDRRLGFMRPDEDELDKGVIELSKYFDAMKQLPSHTRFIQGKKARDIRSEGGEDSILFRPIAQMALAEAIARLEHENEMPLESIISELVRQEEPKSVQLKLRDRKAPWFGVLCDPIDKKMRRKREYQRLCARLFHYLLGGGITDDNHREELRVDFAEARRIGDGELAVNFDGKTVAKDKVRLPSPWQ